MSDDALTFEALVTFHREVFLPDVKRVLDDAFGPESRFSVQMRENFDALVQRLDRLQRQAEELHLAAQRIHAQLDRIGRRLGPPEGDRVYD